MYLDARRQAISEIENVFACFSILGTNMLYLNFLDYMRGDGGNAWCYLTYLLFATYVVTLSYYYQKLLINSFIDYFIMIVISNYVDRNNKKR